MDWDPFPLVWCLLGIGLMLLASRIRRRSLERRTRDLLRRNEVLKRSARDPAQAKRHTAQVIRLRKRVGPTSAPQPRRSNVRALPRR